MPRKVISQWDFGELFPPEATRRVYTVSELTAAIRQLLEEQLGRVWVSGEVSNLRTQSSGHLYFTLKDAGAQLACVLFRGEPVPNRELLQDGQQVLVQGGLTVYEPRGQYQLVVRAIELRGVGALQAAFERLKQKLQAEGLFAPEHKRPLPKYPQRIGVVTSPDGAAWRDVLHVIGRRAPGLEVVLAPCRVQGEGAAAEIAAAIRLLNQWHAAASPGRGLDLILVTRGGGSLEDLWAFNEEIVARAIFESALPVVSAVGHEIDFTISDFVADVRAATPSAAAELITEGLFASRRQVTQAVDRLRQLIRLHLTQAQQELAELSRRLLRQHPRRLLQDRWQRLDELQLALNRAVHRAWRERYNVWAGYLRRLWAARPSAKLALQRQTVAELHRRLRDSARLHLQYAQSRLTTLQARLGLLSPQNVLARGYSITMEAATGKVIRRAAEVSPGQRLKTRLGEGEIHSVAEPPPGPAQ
jgi:exodeoxyribonuclease VII large subunit